MSLTTLKDDLLNEFRAERTMINEQIELLDPLASALRKPAARRLISSGTLIIAEISCYIASLSGIAFVAFMHRVYPFNMLRDLFYDASIRNKVGPVNLLYFVIAIYGISAIGVLGIFIIGRMAREMRLKNDILNQAGRDIKTMVGQHLERKAALDTIEQRHMLGMATIAPVTKMPEVTDVPNPAFAA